MSKCMICARYSKGKLCDEHAEEYKEFVDILNSSNRIGDALRFLVNKKTKIVLESPHGELPYEAVREVRELIAMDSNYHAKFSIGSHGVVYPTFPEDWSWEWVVTRGKYTGTVPKRIDNYVFKEYGVILKTSTVQEIGNVARRHSEGGVAVIDFTDKFDWYDGDFGDSGSCYWSDRASARTMLAEHGALAVRYWGIDYCDDVIRKGLKPDNVIARLHDVGLGRAWLVPDVPTAGDMIIFNQYPKGTQLVTTARMLATWLGYSYKKIDLYNNGSDSGVLYINSGGYVIGTNVERYDEYDFRWEELRTCDICDYTYPLDEMYYVESHDQYLCSDCYNECYMPCEECGRDVPVDDVYGVMDESRTLHSFCEYCYDRLASDCIICGAMWLDDCFEYGICPDCVRDARCAVCGSKLDGDFRYIKYTKEFVCGRCLTDNYTSCYYCGETCRKDGKESDTFIGVGGVLRTVCSDCAPYSAPRCNHCGNRYDRSLMHYIDCCEACHVKVYRKESE